EPYHRFHWVTLPQGMKNSPVLCQTYVSRVLSPVRKLHPDTMILDYMDDILVCARTETYLRKVVDDTISAVEQAGFQIAADKIQLSRPWKYLGFTITERTVVPQNLTIRNDPRTLHDLQQLCGTIIWIWPYLGLTTEELSPLFNLLQGNRDLASPCVLTPEARQALDKVAAAIESRQAHRMDRSLPLEAIILGKPPQYHALIFQWDKHSKDPLLIIEWLFLPHQPHKTIITPQELVAQLITRARSCLRTLAGCEPACIYVPFTLDHPDTLMQTNEHLQVALDSYPSQLSTHYSKRRLFKDSLQLGPRPIRSGKPIKNALTVFTDGSGKSGKSVITWRNIDTAEWESNVRTVEGSPQIAELAAVVRAFRKFKQLLNLVTDSAYIAGIAERAEHALLKEVKNKKLFDLLSELIWLLSHREQPYHITHVRSHTDLPGPITEGNRMADHLAMTATMNQKQAQLSHRFYHQNAPALRRQFKISVEQARAIVTTCPNCQAFSLPSMPVGVNPRGLGALELWQTDITHYAPFGRLKFIHVSIDTFSGAVFASTHAGEK
ncbi:POK8 protein, partial [Loxia leucoptera]|nr:POK8 protein [Loxia leucoptera]